MYVFINTSTAFGCLHSKILTSWFRNPTVELMAQILRETEPVIIGEAQQHHLLLVS